ncbi:MAG: tryptophan-rich sensory protein [Flavobacteriales bacterium]|nr:tryptophan-rich sensory protein [Flavobacteriales bacterium]
MRTAYTYDIIKRVVFIAAVFVLLLVNFLSNSIPFGGQTNADVSSKYPTLITPEGYAFSIWGIIYLSLSVFAVFQFFKGKEIRFYKLIWSFFILNVVANCLWLVAFQNEWLILSLVIMGILLFSLISMFKVFYRLKKSLGTTVRYLFHVPFGLYFGWVSLASVINVAVVLKSFELTFFSANEPIFALIMIAVAAALALVFLVSQKDFIYTFAVLWGIVAIYVKQIDEPLVMYSAKIGALVLLVAIIATFVSERIKVARYGRSV